MKILFAILLILHSLIHLIGFVKAFKLYEIPQLTRSISKPEGGVWALAFILLMTALILYLQNDEMWPGMAIGGVILSQVLITLNWEDARYGTFANLIILGVALSAQGNFKFNQTINNETSTLYELQDRSAEINEQAILPPPVQKWLTVSGALGKRNVPVVHLFQQGEMRIKPGS